MAPTAADVAAARDRGDLAGAIGLALQAWRVSRAPIVARVIEVLDARARDRSPAPWGRSREDFQAAWLAAAAERPDDVILTGHLARTVALKLPVTESFRARLDPARRHERLAERLAVLERRGPDPRTAAALVDIVRLGRLPTTYVQREARRAYGMLGETLLEMGDPRQVAACRSLEPKWSLGSVYYFLQMDMANLVARLERGPQIGDPGPGWDDLVRASDTASTLLGAILADPTDEGLRQVYGDILLEAGDPLGEFIALQYAVESGRASRKDERRMRALWREHLVAWIGEDLERVLIRPVARGGFLHAGELAPSSRAPASAFERAAHDERLATLHTLWRHRGRRRDHVRLVTSPMARNLRVTDIPSSTDLMATLLADDWPQRFTHLTLATAADLQRLCEGAAAPAVEALRSLTFDAGSDVREQLVHLRRAGWLERLHQLCFTCALAFELADLAGHTSHLMDDTSLHRLTLGDDSVVLTRDGDRLIATLAGLGAQLAPEILERLSSSVGLLRVPSEAVNHRGHEIVAAVDAHHPAMRLEQYQPAD